MANMIPEHIRSAVVISRSFEVKAGRSDDGNRWIGYFTIPGKDRQYARDDDGSVSMFDTEDEAIAAAGEDLCEALNGRTRHTHDHFGYKVMGGAELAVKLAEAGISPASFAVLVGTTHERVMEMIDGEMPITRPVNLLAHLLLTVPGAFEEAERYTREIVFDKREVKRGPPVRDAKPVPAAVRRPQ